MATGLCFETRSSGLRVPLDPAAASPLSRCALAALAVVVAFPVPLVSLSGLSIPLPRFVERMAVALVPGAPIEGRSEASASHPVPITQTADETALARGDRLAVLASGTNQRAVSDAFLGGGGTAGPPFRGMPPATATDGSTSGGATGAAGSKGTVDDSPSGPGAGADSPTSGAGGGTDTGGGTGGGGGTVVDDGNGGTGGGSGGGGGTVVDDGNGGTGGGSGGGGGTVVDDGNGGTGSGSGGGGGTVVDDGNGGTGSGSGGGGGTVTESGGSGTDDVGGGG